MHQVFPFTPYEIRMWLEQIQFSRPFRHDTQTMPFSQNFHRGSCFQNPVENTIQIGA